MKITGKLSEIASKVKQREEEFISTLKEDPHLFDAEFSMRLGVKRFNLTANRSLQLFKETLNK